MKIQYADGGELPKELGGMWNSFDLALAACNSYLKKKQEQADKKASKVEKEDANSLNDKAL